MGQVTQDTLKHMEEYAKRSERFPLTDHEVLQLTYLARRGMEAYKYREDLWPKYVVYQDVGDDGCGNGTMRQDEYTTPYLDEAMEYWKMSPKCDGIYIHEKSGERIEHGKDWFDELLDVASNCWDPKTLLQVLAVRTDLIAKLPERMPRLAGKDYLDYFLLSGKRED